jgi:hypothetical protein
MKGALTPSTGWWRVRALRPALYPCLYKSVRIYAPYPDTNAGRGALITTTAIHSSPTSQNTVGIRRRTMKNTIHPIAFSLIEFSL